MVRRITKTAAFTLIELLIVVAIIAILAAIAVPNFLEAQTRAKISREMNDMRSMSTAIESYCVDYSTYTRDSDSSLDFKDSANNYALDMSNPLWGKYANGALSLTTPVSYLNGLLKDPFGEAVAVSGAGAIGYRIGSGSWSYANTSVNSGDSQGADLTFSQMGKRGSYVIIGVGPDGYRCRMGYKNFPFMTASDPNNKEGNPSVSMEMSASTSVKPPMPNCYVTYDSSNGSVSIGDIYRFGGSYQDGRFMLDGKVVGAETSPGGNVW
jgi:prepilin-type N-terminal cleavage/methylation domain-containing protein